MEKSQQGKTEHLQTTGDTYPVRMTMYMEIETDVASRLRNMGNVQYNIVYFQHRTKVS